MRVAAIIWCAAIAGLQVYLFRRISDDLVKNHIEGPKGFRSLLAPWVNSGFVQMVEDEIRFWNGSKIYLCHCKDEKDRFKYLGAEIHVLLIDELTSFTDVIYRFLRGRVRAVGLANIPDDYKGAFPRILCSSNPGNIGHQWVKNTFIDDVVPMALRRMSDEEGAMLRQYIPARLDDNPSMTVDDPTYRGRLRGLGNDALVRAMESGDWDVVAGAFFECFRRERHIIKPFEIPPYWLRFGSFDWGSARPFSYGLWAISDGSLLPGNRQYPAGAMIRYREWYGASGPNVGLKMTAEQVGQGIKLLEIGQDITYRVADPACFRVDGGPSIAERMYDAGKGVLFRAADNSRISGWDQMRDRIIGDDDPMMYVFETCTDFIRTVPAVQHDDKRPEDVDTDGEDHCADEVRYACMSRPYTRRKVEAEPIRGLSDMTLDEVHRLAGPPRSGSRPARI